MTAPVSPSAPVAWGILNHGNNLFWPEIALDREGAEGMLAALNEKQAGYGVVRSVEPLYASPAPSMVGLREKVARAISGAPLKEPLTIGAFTFATVGEVLSADLQQSITDAILALLAREGV